MGREDNTAGEEELRGQIARDLHLLSLICERWLATWELLPERLRQTADAARAKTRGTEKHLRMRAVRILDVLDPYLGVARRTKLTPGALPNLTATLEQLETAERREADREAEGSLYTSLHVLKNALIALNASQAVLVAQKCLDACHQLASELVPDPQPVLRKVRIAFESEEIPAIRQAATALTQVAEMVQIPAKFVGQIPTDHDAWTHSWFIVSVEDLAEWRLTIRKVVGMAQQYLGPSFRLEYEEHTNAASAKAALESALRTQGGPRPLLVLDLGIPRDSSHAMTYNAGRELLRYSRETLDVPVIVMTTPHQFLDDHLLAFRLGVVGYFIKGPQAEQSVASELDLLDALVCAIRPMPAHTLFVSNDGTRTVRIDDLEFRLDPMPFAILTVLSKHRRADQCLPVTIRMIEDGLHNEFDLECLDVEDAVYKLRSAMGEAFALAGRAIRPSEDILVSTRRGEEFAYRIVARPSSSCVDVLAHKVRTRVLVVEDDVEAWQQPLIQLLGQYGYEVAAADHRELALKLAHEFEPQILCLDVCIPHTACTEPEIGAGLALLQDVKGSLPDVRVVILTSFADHDLFRNAASRLEVRPDDFVRKQGNFHETVTELVLKLWRAELEIERQARLPLPNLPQLPYLLLRTRHDALGQQQIIEIRVYGKPWRPTDNEAKLLLLLARNPGRSISKEKIYDAIWPIEDVEELSDGDVDLPNALKNLVKRLRQRIAREWLGIEDRLTGREVATAILPNDGKQSYMLNARVEWETIS
jgi:DNA-binding response OmpR family regulator